MAKFKDNHLIKLIVKTETDLCLSAYFTLIPLVDLQIQMLKESHSFPQKAFASRSYLKQIF